MFWTKTYIFLLNLQYFFLDRKGTPLGRFPKNNVKTQENRGVPSRLGSSPWRDLIWKKEWPWCAKISLHRGLSVASALGLFSNNKKRAWWAWRGGYIKRTYFQCSSLKRQNSSASRWQVCLAQVLPYQPNIKSLLSLPWRVHQENIYVSISKHCKRPKTSQYITLSLVVVFLNFSLFFVFLPFIF